MNYGVVDAFNRNERPYTYLASANKDIIGIILAKDLAGDLCFNNISQVTFKVNKYEDKDLTPNYSQIENFMLVQLTNIGWFQIIHTNKEGDGNNEYIEVTCASLENEATTKTLTSFGQLGVSSDEQGGLDRYKIYDLVDVNHSIIHIWLQKMPSWNVGYIDPEITSEYRTFTNDKVGAYSFLVNDVSETFQCIFQFNTEEQTINAYKLENIGTNTSIYLSYDNLVKTTKLEADYSDIKTVYTVAGGDDNGTTLGIIEVNPTGSNQIFNYSYYKSKMSSALQTKLDAFEIEYNSRLNDFAPAIEELKTLYEELNDLNNKLPSEPTSTNWSEYGLNELNTKYDVYNNNMAIYISSNPTTYHTNYVLREAVNTEIALRKSQIATKETQISNQKQLCESLTLNLQSYLGDTLYKELSRYYHEDTFTDDTFVVTEAMSDSDALQMKRDLLALAQSDLLKRCKPSYTLEVNALNFTVIPEFKVYTDQLQLGNIMTLDFGDGVLVESRLLKIHINWDNPDDFSMTFSSKNRLDGYDYQLAEIQSQANGVTTAYNISGIGWNTAKNNTSTFNQYMSSTLDLANQKLQSSSKQTFVADSTGTKWKKESGDSYSPNQMWGVENGLYLTQDSWNSVSLAIGEGTYNGQTVYGIWAPLLCGSLIIGNQLAISNQAGNFTITNTSGFTATATVGANTYSAGINPSTPAEIINVKVNGVNKLYVDTIGNKVVFSGSLIAGDINIGSNRFIVDNTGLVTINSNGLVVNSTNFSLTSNGILSCNNITATNGNFTNGNFSGAITTSTIIGTTFTNVNGSNTQVAKIQNGIFTGTSFNAYDYNSVIGGITGVTFGILQPGYFSVGMGTGVSLTTIIDKGEITTNSINCYFINGGTPITTDNRTNYTYPPSFHYQDSNTITPILTGGGNVGLNGINVASVNYVQDNFQPKSSSDLRLKKNILTLDIPDDLFMDLKPKQYEFKCSPYPETKVCGFIAQELESVFESYGLNPLEYNIIDKMQIRNYTDEGQYIDDYIHRINYENFHAIEISMIQKLYRRIEELELKLKFN